MGCAGSKKAVQPQSKANGSKSERHDLDSANETHVQDKQSGKHTADGRQAQSRVDASSASPQAVAVTPAPARVQAPQPPGQAAQASPVPVAAQSPPPRQHPGFQPPADEAERLEMLYSLQILDTEPEARFDDITRIVKAVFKVQFAAITLVDKDRLWYKSIIGLDLKQMGRSDGFCAAAIRHDKLEVLVVEDALLDARFREIPAVTQAGIRFYCGAPLVTSNGHKIGTLCVLDLTPQKVDAMHLAMLGNFASMVVKEIERDRVKRVTSDAGSQANHSLKQALDSVKDSVMLVDTSIAEAAKWTLQFANENWVQMTGLSREVAGLLLFNIFTLDPSVKAETLAEIHQSAQQKRQDFAVPVTFKGAQRTLLFRMASSDLTGGNAPNIPSFVQLLGQKNQNLWFVVVQPDKLLMPHTSIPPSGVNQARTLGAVPVQLAGPVVEEPFSDVQLGPLLGKGAFGKVYRAIWNRTTVACKIVETTVKGSSKKMDSMGQLIEAVLGQDLAHPNVVQTYKHTTRVAPQDDARLAAFRQQCGMDVQDCQEPRVMETWLVLEYCHKGCLLDAVDRGWLRTERSIVHGTPDMDVIWSTAREIAAGMAYLHSLDILHGDLTGGNVLLGSNDKDRRGFIAKVSDFGLSRVAADDINTKTYGTVTHMPPELLREGLLTKSADVFAFAVLMYEMYVGERAWAGLRQPVILHKVGIANEQLKLPGGTPEMYQALFQDCITSDHKLRPTFQDVLDRIDDRLDAAEASK